MADNNDYDIQMLSTVELLNKYWEASAPHLTKWIKRNEHKNITLEDIYMGVCEARLFMFVWKKDEEMPKVKLVLIFELASYDKTPSMNILCISGTGLVEFGKKYWDYFKGWAYIAGARGFDAFVPPALERVLEQFGFARASIHVRQPLGPQ